MTTQGHDTIPTWSGDASQFEAYATACRWFQKATKESDRKLVVARLWGKLTGSAKSVVRHLDPDAFEDDTGLARFLDILRQSPLQQLPVPDSFNKLEAWNRMRRGDRESITELIVREEETFTDLQQALTRARKDRGLTTANLASRRPEVNRVVEVDPPSTPSRSPLRADARSPDTPAERPQTANDFPFAPVPESLDFFSDEMRGYRLLKACRLSHQERQNVLVQTTNSTQFLLIRRALRTLFAEDSERPAPQRSQSKIWL